jgi:hypothetical protein
MCVRRALHGDGAQIAAGSGVERDARGQGVQWGKGAGMQGSRTDEERGRGLRTQTRVVFIG